MIAVAKTEHFVQDGYLGRMGGVVHVGAHEGQEIPWYLYRGHEPILAFEPNPEPARRLAYRYAADDRVHVECCALGDTSASLALWIPRHLHDGSDDEQSASLLRADRDSGYPWGERDLDGRYIEVPVVRFDQWVSRKHLQAWPWRTLVVDVQGHELAVLKGFGDFLDEFDFLNIECSAVPIYKGGASAQDVIDFLAERGFEQRSPICDHDDIFFVREGL